MPKFGKKSADNLSQCHPDLQLLLNAVVRDFDCSVICGHRSEQDQNEVFQAGKSKVQFPDSKHNRFPSRAVDVGPYDPKIKGVNWKDLKRFYFFGGYVKKTAEILGIKIRWGGDWDSDTEITDQSFNDLPHFEIVEE